MEAPLAGLTSFVEAVRVNGVLLEGVVPASFKVDVDSGNLKIGAHGFCIGLVISWEYHRPCTESASDNASYVLCLGLYRFSIELTTADNNQFKKKLCFAWDQSGICFDTHKFCIECVVLFFC